MPDRRGLLPSSFGTTRDLNPGSRTAGSASRQYVHPSRPSSLKNKNCVEEPDELMKTSHLKSDKTPILMSL
jgi:hypothetical protein